MCLPPAARQPLFFLVEIPFLLSFSLWSSQWSQWSSQCDHHTLSLSLSLQVGRQMGDGGISLVTRSSCLQELMNAFKCMDGHFDPWVICKKEYFRSCSADNRAVSHTSGCFRLSLRPRLQALLYAKSTMCTCLLVHICKKHNHPQVLLARSHLQNAQCVPAY